ncbi:3-hydroxyacyl-ACP dehydratase [Ideonella sp. BN130291]|uniref:3-hydroxyacyl-ACP dehydratase n=1 Tax=Ideonella sp. BN130291 TaxID=3112940 RepID=UPI002E26BE8A|nr:3-hydroxyacyl-ACP dehydratase [Ideonella sp. BN130291]
MNAATIVREVPASHPAFAGHFPGQPLLPGVSLLAEVMEAAQAQPGLAGRLDGHSQLQAAKFLAPVRPGSTLHIGLQWDTAGLRFEVHCAGTLAAKGQWSWSAGE